jgi:hypothetical protein
MTVAVDSLPWAALGLQDAEIRWTDLGALADAAVESGYVREQLLQRGQAELDRQVSADSYDASDLTDLGVAAVFALAADRLNDEARRQAADYLLDMLKRAGETGEDYLEEAAERVAGRLGPIIIEPLVRLIETDRCQLHCWFSAFALLCVADTADANTGQKVARFCRRMVRECPDRFEAVSLALGPAWVLQSLNDRASLPLLKAVYDESRDADLLHVIQHLEKGQGARAPHAWHVPVEEWLPDLVAALREAGEAERLARESSPTARPPEPEAGPSDEADYTADWKQWVCPPDRPLDAAPKETRVPILRDQPKVGRNDPCPCGSGKKYKKCCGR